MTKETLRRAVWTAKNELRDKMLDFAYEGHDIEHDAMYQAALECWRSLTRILDESR